MTHEQLMRLGFAFCISPAFFVCEYLEKKHGRLHLSDLQAMDKDEFAPVRDAVPTEFVVRVADQMNEALRNNVAEILGPERVAILYEAIATYLRTQAKAKQ